MSTATHRRPMTSVMVWPTIFRTAPMVAPQELVALGPMRILTTPLLEVLRSLKSQVANRMMVLTTMHWLRRMPAKTRRHQPATRLKKA